MNYSPIVTNKVLKNSKFKITSIEDNEHDMYEGRVDLKKRSTNSSLALKGENYKACDVKDELSDMFFSGENMKRLQKMIKKEIFEKTKGKYRLDEDQDDMDLLVAMRGVYMNEARFLPYKIKHQIKDLNRKVILNIVPDMITNIKQYYSYIKEINEPIKPIMRPLNVNNAGRRTLPALTSVWNI
jgi:hypothetical protein